MKTLIQKDLSKRSFLLFLVILGTICISSTALTSLAAKHEMGQADMHYESGNLLLKRGRHSEAISEYKNALESNPDHVDALFELGTAYMRAEEYGLASMQFRTLLAVVPGNKMAAAYAEYCERIEDELKSQGMSLRVLSS